MDKDRLRQVVVVAATTSGIAIGATADYGSAGTSGSTIIPANYAFGIWAPIYVGSLAYAVYQALPSRRRDPLLRRVGWPAAAAYFLVGLWVRTDTLWLYEGLIAASLIAAAIAYGRLGPAVAGTSRAETWLVRAPLGLFAGWITLATAAGTAEGLLASGVDDLGLGPTVWGVLVLLVAGAVAGTVTLHVRASLAYPVAVSWGLVGAAVQHLPTTPATGGTAAAMAALVAAAAAWTARGDRSPRGLRRLPPRLHRAEA